MIGIFDPASKVQIGYYIIICEINQSRGKGVINETRAALSVGRNFLAIFQLLGSRLARADWPI
jgi:hypothetical protein